MSERKTILIFPCGSEIAMDIYSSVRYSIYFKLIGASSVDDHGKYVFEEYIGEIPNVNDITFIPYLSNIVKEHAIDAIYPTMDSVIAITKAHEDELGCKVIASDRQTTDICLSKSLSYKKLQKIIKVPHIFNPLEITQTDFPVFAKPDIGYSSIGTRKINSNEDLHSAMQNIDGIIFMEYLPGEEYTIDCFTDRNGKLLFCGARKRTRIRNGVSMHAEYLEQQEEFRTIAENINSEIKFRGAWFFQIKRDKNGELTLLEIASRMAGSSLISKAAGVNLALLTLFDAFDYDVTLFTNDYHATLDRSLGNSYTIDISFDSVYCDYDDCLVFADGNVNTELVKFLYDCLNKDIRIYLLSRHKGDDLELSLSNHRLAHLFDDIIQIPINADKADFIKESNPIFIDDSYAERLNIKSKLGIPVFAPEMVDVISMTNQQNGRFFKK